MWARTAAVLGQRRKEVNQYILQLLFGARLYRRPNAETLSPAEGREVQMSFESNKSNHPTEGCAQQQVSYIHLVFFISALFKKKKVAMLFYLNIMSVSKA